MASRGVSFSGLRRLGLAPLCVLLVVLEIGRTHASAVLPGPAADPAPRRIVSLNLCTDLMVLLLAERARIASLSFLAADPAQSPLAGEVGALPLNHGRAEEIVALDPDLILTGTFTTPHTTALLRRFGYRVEEIPLARSLDDIRRNIRRVARAIGEPSRGEALADSLGRRLEAPSEAEKQRPRPSALVLAPGGFTAGRDTLIDDLLRRAGFTNAAAENGIASNRNIDVETILRLEADLIVITTAGPAPPSASSRLLAHPALRRYMDRHHVVHIPAPWLTCETPFLADAFARLREAARRASRGGRP